MNVQDLLAGNRRFIAGADKRKLGELVAKGQRPVATVVSCSDSRVPVEVIFDRLVPGELFVIRVAGNVIAGAGVKGSIEYALAHLKTPHLVVLGHTDCGAVKAVLSGGAEGDTGRLLNHVRVTSRDMSAAVLENLALQVGNVLAMACVRDALDRGTLEVWGMLYDLSTGRVEILSRNGLPCSETAP